MFVIVCMSMSSKLACMCRYAYIFYVYAFVHVCMLGMYVHFCKCVSGEMHLSVCEDVCLELYACVCAHTH